MSTGPTSAAPPAPMLRVPGLDALNGVIHGFTTREGGASVGPLASLNLARREHEHTEHLAENWRIALYALGLPGGAVALMHQVHGRAVLSAATGPGPTAVVGDGDAMVTTEMGVVLVVRTADCVPVLFAAPGAVAVAHAGWRGTVAGVVGAAVRALCEAAGCGPVGVHAAVGPHIGPDAYEVGDEVVSGLREAGVPDDAFLRPRPGARDHVDLGEAVAWQLRDAGVGAVEHTGGCTATDRRFYSHRRDGPSTGRQAGLIARVA